MPTRIFSEFAGNSRGSRGGYPLAALGTRGSRGGYPLVALGSEDWCNRATEAADRQCTEKSFFFFKPETSDRTARGKEETNTYGRFRCAPRCPAFLTFRDSGPALPCCRFVVGKSRHRAHTESQREKRRVAIPGVLVAGATLSREAWMPIWCLSTESMSPGT